MSSETIVEMTINAAPATIFPYLVDPAKFVQWMGTEVAIDPRPGGEFRALCGGVNPAAGEYVEVVHNQKVVFTFGWDVAEHPIPAGSSRVEITLTPTGTATVVRLVHSGLPDDATSDHHAGWSYYFARLDKVVNGVDPGVDNPDLGGS